MLVFGGVGGVFNTEHRLAKKCVTRQAEVKEIELVDSCIGISNKVRIKSLVPGL